MIYFQLFSAVFRSAVFSDLASRATMQDFLEARALLYLFTCSFIFSFIIKLS